MDERICPNCGVILDRGVESCPLCGDKNGDQETLQVGLSQGYPSEILKMDSRERARYRWEMSGIIAASGILVSLVVDLVIGKGMNWSVYPVSVLAAIWIYITLLIFTRRKVWILLPGLAVNTLALLLMIDLASPPINWFVPIALPFTISFFVLTGVVVLLSSRSLYKGFNVLAIIFMAVGVLCIIFELFTDLFVKGRIDIEWSAIAAAAIIPFSAILMFVHYRLKKGLNLKSYFHI
jgi:hypothetical protein